MEVQASAVLATVVVELDSLAAVLVVRVARQAPLVTEEEVLVLVQVVLVLVALVMDRRRQLLITLLVEGM